MSQIIPATANRLAINRGWQQPLVPWNTTNLVNSHAIIYLKNYLILKEYLKFYNINLLTFHLNFLNHNLKILYLLIYEQQAPLKKFNVKKKKIGKINPTLYSSVLKLKLRKTNCIFNKKLKRSPSKIKITKQKLKLHIRRKINASIIELLHPKIRRVKQKTVKVKIKLKNFNSKKQKFKRHIKHRFKWGQKKLKRFRLKMTRVGWKIKYKGINTKKLNHLVTKFKINSVLIKNIVEIQYAVEQYLKRSLGLSLIVKVKKTSDFVHLTKIEQKWKFENSKQFPDLVKHQSLTKILFSMVATQRYLNPNIMAELIVQELMTRDKKRRHILKTTNSFFEAMHFNYILGYKIILTGKINNQMKTTTQYVNFLDRDATPVQEFEKRISYAMGIARTKNGLVGIKVWLYY